MKFPIETKVTWISNLGHCREGEIIGVQENCYYLKGENLYSIATGPTIYPWCSRASIEESRLTRVNIRKAFPYGEIQANDILKRLLTQWRLPKDVSYD